MPIVTLPGGEIRDEIRQPLYDTIELTGPTGIAGVYNFFSSIVTPAGQPKTIAKTNMTTPGQLQTAVSFRTQGLCLDISNFLVANATVTSPVAVILERGGLEFNVGVKNYWQGPSRFAMGRLTTDNDTGALVSQQSGWPSIQPVIFQGRHVVDINPLQNFLVKLSINTQDLIASEQSATLVAANTQISLLASLKGLLRRPVQ